MTRLLVIAATCLAALVLVPSVVAADARQAKLPPATSNVEAIKKIWPKLYRNEIARKDKRSWERLRRSARTAWMRTHQCHPATLNRRYELRAESSWSTMTRTWACGGMTPDRIAFLGCISDHEGGRTYPDVRYGGGRGYPGGYGNVVFGHLQVRPGWYRGAMEGRPGTYAGDWWDWALYRFAVHPVNQARVVAFIAHDQYATQSMCS